MFEIADAEMASGIFQDIEKAIAAPGTEVEKSFAPYVIHRDYDNSRKLNAYLAGGGRVFGVCVRDRFYLMEIR